MFLGSGMILGPLYGSQMKELLGYRLACDNVAIIAFVLGLCHLVLTRNNKQISLNDDEF